MSKYTVISALSVAVLVLQGVGIDSQSISHAQEAGKVSVSDGSSGQRDFDFNFGTWKTRVSRLEKPLSNSNTWLEYEGISTVRKVWNGRASLFELDVEGTAGRIQGVGLRLYNPRTRQWSLNWANVNDGVITTPMIGEFENGRGTFFSQELFDGRAIFVRNTFSDITPDSSRFEQAFSADGGKTWETNWIMTFELLGDTPDSDD